MKVAPIVHHCGVTDSLSTYDRGSAGCTQIDSLKGTSVHVCTVSFSIKGVYFGGFYYEYLTIPLSNILVQLMNTNCDVTITVTVITLQITYKKLRKW